MDSPLYHCCSSLLSKCVDFCSSSSWSCESLDCLRAVSIRLHHHFHLHRQESDNRDVDAPRQARRQPPHGRASQDEHLHLPAHSTGGPNKAKTREGGQTHDLPIVAGASASERGGGLRGPAGVAGSAKRRARGLG